jgi:tetratricopeptide (TPR) repeat protein
MVTSVKRPGPANKSTPDSAQGITTIWIYAALLLATFAGYLQVVHFQFVNYDDPFYVSHNPHVREGLTLAGIKWALTSGEGANWFPLTRLSHLMDSQLFGMDSGGHHFTSLLIHALSTLLLFAFLYRATRARWPSAFVAFVFALHPVHVESVAWVSERKDVLCAFFWMLSLWAYVRYTERPERNRYLLVLLCFCLGLMSKPMIVTLPFLFMLLDIWPLRRKPPLLEKLPFFAISAVAAVTTYFVQQASGAVQTLQSIPLGLRLQNALVSSVVYIVKLFWPSGLAVFYPYPTDIPLWQPALALLILAGISTLVLRLRQAQPYLAVGWFWYLITIAPVIGIVQVGAQARADRYLYVPMIGLTIILAWGFSKPKPLLKAAAAVACLACLILTWRQVQYWRDSESLFQHAVDVTQNNDLAQHNLGTALLEVPGRLPDAISHLQAALAINANSASTHTDLGNALSKMPDRVNDSITEYRAAIRIDPNLPIPHSNLGISLSKLPGAISEAVTECQTAVHLDPNFVQAHNCLGVALSRTGRFKEAATEFETALRLEPDNAEARDNLAATNRATLTNDPTRLPDAISQDEAALRQNPNSADTEYNLGLALAKTPGRMADAITHFEAALRIDPTNAEAHNNLGFALAQLPGRAPEAIAHFESALRINPNYSDAHYNLGVALSNIPGRMPEAIRHFEAAERLKPDPALEDLLRQLKAH